MVNFMHWAIVVDNVDPDGLNRVKVSWMGETETVSDWIPVAAPYAGDSIGQSFIPNLGDQVLAISFDHHNVQKVIAGSFWSNAANPPQTKENPCADLNSDGKNSLRFLKSKSGNMLVFDDSEGKEKIQVITADGVSRIEIDVSEKLLSLNTEHNVSVDAAGIVSIQAEEVEITGKNEVNISTDNYQVEAESGYKNNASNGISIEGSGISLN